MADGRARLLGGPRGPWRFVVTLGVVALFADMTYEGSRGIVGPYLAALGASGAIVGFVAGFGELVGYGLRLISGPLSDRTGRYWAVTWAGYIVQMLAVPALALAGSWQVAAVLIVAERAGRAIRNPPRDAMLAHATESIGRGKGFGLHEAMDQTGALAGPLIAAGILGIGGSYQAAFAILAVPAVLTLTTLGLARFAYPNPAGAHARASDLVAAGIPKRLWLYVGGAMLVAAGFADFSLIAFHFERGAVIDTAFIPVFYAAAMGAGGLGSLVFGWLFDRIGLAVIIPVTALTALFAPLAFLGPAPLAFVGVLLWGVGTGAHDSILAAAVAEMVPRDRLASGYGLFTMLYGVAWFAGSAVLGLLYDISLPALVAFSMAAQLLAVPVFVAVRSRGR
jgi:MFS family permease